MDPARHPQHDAIARTVRSWFHDPFEAMGYRAVKRRWGTYWNTGMVYVSGLQPPEIPDFLADLRAYCGDQRVFVSLDGRDLDAALGPRLLAADCTRGMADAFLAHVGPVPEAPAVENLTVDPVSESNLHAFAETRLEIFTRPGEEVGPSRVHAEVDQRRAELPGSGRGLLARIDGEPAGIMWYYEETQDAWVNFLGALPQFRGRGIGRYLLCWLLRTEYSAGRRSVLINVETTNEGAIRLYRRLGFRDEVYWRRRYLPPWA